MFRSPLTFLDRVCRQICGPFFVHVLYSVVKAAVRLLLDPTLLAAHVLHTLKRMFFHFHVSERVAGASSLTTAV